MKVDLHKLRDKVRGIEHLLFGAVTAAAGFLLTVLEKVQNQDISALLQKWLPSGWTPAEAVALMGVAIVFLHVLINGPHRCDPPNGGGSS